MAEALVRRFGGGLVDASSAGLRPGAKLAGNARSVMAEIGIDLSDHRPRALEEVEGPVDFVISLCEVIAPGQDLFPGARRLWWRVQDPIGGPPEGYRATRDRIWDCLRPLLVRLTENAELPLRLADPPSD
jgi:arsenate reductase